MKNESVFSKGWAWFKGLGRWAKVGIVVVLAFVLLMVVVPTEDKPEVATPAAAPVEATEEPEATPEVTEEPVATEEPEATPEATEEPVETTEEPEPLTNDELIAQALADSGVEGAAVSEDFSTFVVEYPVSDNFTMNMVKTGAENDAKDIMEALYNSDAEFESLSLRGLFPVVDAYGNESQGQVFWAHFEEGTLDKINWDNLLILELSDIADLYNLHPDLQ